MFLEFDFKLEIKKDTKSKSIGRISFAIFLGLAMKVESNFTFIDRMGFIVVFTTWRSFRMLSDRKVITRKWIIAIKEQ